MMSIERVLSEYQVWNGTVERQAAESNRIYQAPVLPSSDRMSGGPSCTQAVLDYLQGHRWFVTARQLSTVTGFTTRRVHSSLVDLRDRGLVERAPNCERPACYRVILT